MTNNRYAAFSLLEMLVVITIIATLSSLALPYLQRASSASRPPAMANNIWEERERMLANWAILSQTIWACGRRPPFPDTIGVWFWQIVDKQWVLYTTWSFGNASPPPPTYCAGSGPQHRFYPHATPPSV